MYTLMHENKFASPSSNLTNNGRYLVYIFSGISVKTYEVRPQFSHRLF